MIDLTIGQTASLQGPAITICRCWDIVRRDGQAFYFTDHDKALRIDDKNYSPIMSPAVSAAQKASGLKTRNREVRGVLNSDLITEEDLACGLYKDAMVREFLIDWEWLPGGKFMRQVYWIADTTYTSDGWEAQIESVASWTNAPVGMNYTRDCWNDWGDARCKVVRDDFLSTGVITGVVDNTHFTLAGGGGSDDYFNDGELEFTSGPNVGFKYRIKRSYADGRVILPIEPIGIITVGDAYKAWPGCNHRPNHCSSKFSNFVNYGGFPFIIGSDRLINSPDSST